VFCIIYSARTWNTSNLTKIIGTTVIKIGIHMLTMQQSLKTHMPLHGSSLFSQQVCSPILLSHFIRCTSCLVLLSSLCRCSSQNVRCYFSFALHSTLLNWQLVTSKFISSFTYHNLIHDKFTALFERAVG
jgi:hypothetical protein